MRSRPFALFATFLTCIASSIAVSRALPGQDRRADGQIEAEVESMAELRATVTAMRPADLVWRRIAWLCRAC